MHTSVTIKLVGSELGRPPIERLVVDVELSNDAPEPRWVLVPSALPLATGGVDKLEQLTAKAGATSVAVGRLLGTGGRYAMKLGPGAHVTLRKLGVSWWREDPTRKDVELDVQFAATILVGGEPLATWFDNDPTIGGIVEVDMASAQHTASHRSPDGKELPLVMTTARTETVKLTAP